MFFRQEYLVRTRVNLSQNWGMKFEYGGPSHVIVEVRAPSSEEVARGHKPTSTWLTVRSQRVPSAAIYSMFVSLSRGHMPEGSIEDEWPDESAFDENGRLISGAPFDVLPSEFKSFSDQVRREHSDYASRTYRVLRWRNGGLGLHQVLSAGSSECSFDGQTWMCMPEGIIVHAWTEIGDFLVDRSLHDQVVNMVQLGADEPLGHELLGEAWELKSSSPRSSLIMGIAAAEVGFKKCVAELIPDAEWLVDNLPSPPLDKMLRRYLPTLPVKLRVREEPPRIPNAVLGTIKKGIEQRNDATHKGAQGMDGEDLTDLLLAVRDVLSLLDYYSGHEWALEHLSSGTKKDLGLGPRST